MTSEPVPAAPSDAPLSLQLDRAEFADRKAESCAACGQPLGGTYYEINGRICCAACHERVAAKLAARPGAAGFARAAAAGLGAAAAGAGIYYAVQAATGYNFSLISILVGYLVGRAVHWGARGAGGWPYQALAILLTYLAIVSHFAPVLIANARARAEAQHKAAQAAAAQTPAGSPGAARPGGAAAVGTPSGNAGTAPWSAQSAPSGGAAAAQAPAGSTPSGSAAQPPAAGPRPRRPPTAAAYVLFGLRLLGVSAILPFLGAVSPIGFIIIAVGLYEAWKLNRRPRLDISGPHAVTPPGWRS